MENILYSEIESKRFDAIIYRCKTNNFDIDVLIDSIKKNMIDVLILRLPTNTKSEHNKLLSLPYPVLHADSLVYYKCDLSKIENNKILRDDLSFVVLKKDKYDTIKNIIPIIFQNYQNHYFSNPIFDKDKITAGYTEWALSFLVDPKKICWSIVNATKKVVAIACCSFYLEQNICEINLAGTVPEFSRQGVYSFLIKQIQLFLINNNYENILISTQLQNVAVQKNWIREGFNMVYSYDTYHINSKLGHLKSK